MKDIDFLPSRFRECGKQRRALMWRIIALGAVAVAIVGFHLSQVALSRSIERELKPVRDRFPLMTAENARLQQLQTDLAAAQQFAELYTYLRYPWPRTQLLAAMTRELPPEITFVDIRLSSVLPTGVSATPPTLPADANVVVPPPLRDLKSLRDEQDRFVTIVTLTGTTSDVAVLHTYVAGFANSPLFDSANLESLESIAQQDRAESQFSLRLTVRPGYGQPGGPTALRPPSSLPPASLQPVPQKPNEISANSTTVYRTLENRL